MIEKVKVVWWTERGERKKKKKKEEALLETLYPHKKPPSRLLPLETANLKGQPFPSSSSSSSTSRFDHSL